MGNGMEDIEEAIHESDARAMVRLLGETVAIEGGHQEKKRFLMDGLCGLVGADAWVWTLGCLTEPDGEQNYGGFLHDGFDSGRFARLLKAIEHPDLAKIAAPFCAAVARGPAHATVRRQEMDPDILADWPAVKELWENADIGPFILSGYPLDEISLGAIAIYRRFDAPAFTEREKRIAHLILSEVPWLHSVGWPEDRGTDVPQLYPQQRVVLELLIDGLSRKAIADHMGLSENTVAGYAKDVFRHFGVHSQPQLMRKFLIGDPV